MNVSYSSACRESQDRLLIHTVFPPTAVLLRDALQGNYGIYLQATQAKLYPYSDSIRNWSTSMVSCGVRYGTKNK
jgi:hypothetical protein